MQLLCTISRLACIVFVDGEIRSVPQIADRIPQIARHGSVCDLFIIHPWNPDLIIQRNRSTFESCTE